MTFIAPLTRKFTPLLSEGNHDLKEFIGEIAPFFWHSLCEVLTVEHLFGGAMGSLKTDLLRNCHAKVPTLHHFNDFSDWDNSVYPFPFLSVECMAIDCSPRAKNSPRWPCPFPFPLRFPPFSSHLKSRIRTASSCPTPPPLSSLRPSPSGAPSPSQATSPASVSAPCRVLKAVNQAPLSS